MIRALVALNAWTIHRADGGIAVLIQTWPDGRWRLVEADAEWTVDCADD